MPAKTNKRKNNKRDENALDLAAIAQAMENGAFHGGSEEAPIVTAPIMAVVMDEDIAALLTDDILSIVLPSDEAKTKREDAFGKKAQAKELMNKRTALNVEELRKEFNYLTDKVAAARKTTRENLFGAQGGEISKAADLLKGNPKYDDFIKRINDRVELILLRDEAKLMEDCELARMMLGEAEAESAELLRQANELGAAATKLFRESDEILRSVGTTVKPFNKEVRS